MLSTETKKTSLAHWRTAGNTMQRRDDVGHQEWRQSGAGAAAKAPDSMAEAAVPHWSGAAGTESALLIE